MLPIFSYSLPERHCEREITVCTFLLQGELYINDRSCRIVQRYLEFDGGVAYGIDCILTDPNIGGRCDTFISHDVSVSPSVNFCYPFEP